MYIIFSIFTYLILLHQNICVSQNAVTQQNLSKNVSLLPGSLILLNVVKEFIPVNSFSRFISVTPPHEGQKMHCFSSEKPLPIV